MTDQPQSAPTARVVFVCVKNGGKSQMAAGLMRQVAGDAVHVDSAGTRPGDSINALSAQVLQEVGVDITHETPKPLARHMVVDADLVVALGRDAVLSPELLAGAGARVIHWDTDEPSERGIDGIERMRLVRDDITARVTALAADLTGR